KTVFRLFLQTMADNLFERHRNMLAVPNHLRGILSEDRGHGVNLGLTRKGTIAAQHLVKNCPKAEDVTAMIHRLAPQLFWGHVGNGSQHRPYLGLSRHGRRRARRDRLRTKLRIHELGNTEVQNLDAPVFREEEVFRLEVTMQNALFMRRHQPLRYLPGIIHCLPPWDQTIEQPLAQGLSFEQ